MESQFILIHNVTGLKNEEISNKNIFLRLKRDGGTLRRVTQPLLNDSCQILLLNWLAELTYVLLQNILTHLRALWFLLFHLPSGSLGLSVSYISLFLIR